jgi:hypothetical protein
MTKKVKKDRPPVIFVKDDGVLHSELKSISDITKIPMSQIVREGTIERLAHLRATHPRLRAA